MSLQGKSLSAAGQLNRGALQVSPWLASAILALCVLPVISLLLAALEPQGELWQHLSAYVLPYAARDTLFLVVGVGLLTSLIGIALASLVSFTEFPGRRIVAAAAILPLAFPIYLHAFVYVELLDAAGPVQTFLRESFGQGLRLPEIRSIWGAVAIFSAVLYPYVYLPLVLAFSAQPVSYRDAARTLGCSAWGSFLRVQLPAARPSLVAGLMLALMEALADFGASEYLGVRTFAYAIYSTWVSRGSLPGAAQIAVILVGIVAILILVEQHSRRAASYQVRAAKANPAPRVKLQGLAALAASGLCFTIIITAFAIPAAFLVVSALKLNGAGDVVPQMLRTLLTTASLGVVGASIVACLAMTLTLLQRWESGSFISRFAAMGSLGYAMPGVVLALGLMYASGAIDNGVDTLARSSFGLSTGLIIGGTPLILFWAYLSRFMAVAHGPLQAHLQLVPKNLDHVARTLGRSPAAVTRSVLLPQLQATFAAAWLLLVIDIMKELPMTLLLRPIGIETLATSLYGFASRGTFEDGSFEALAILLCGVVAVLALQRQLRRGALRLL